MKIAVENKTLSWFDVKRIGEFDTFEQENLNELVGSGTYDFIITYGETGHLSLLQQIDSKKKPKYLQHQIDIDSFIKQQGHSFPASKKTLFSQAVGRKTQTVVDATGGWLGDTLLMCSQNYAVTVLERHWLLQGFIAEACETLKNSEWLHMNKAPLPKLVRCDAIQFFTDESCDELNGDPNVADCIYIDPMFPPKVKKSAAVRKSMQVLHDLVGQDADAEQLFAAAWQSNIKRIVVKRPDYAETLGNSAALSNQNIKPTETLSGKLVRYDVYIR